MELEKMRSPGDEKVKPKDAEFITNDIADSNSYTFATTTTGSLTDMSSGTTQLLGSNIDDTASPLTNIGFDFFYMGARFTQFSINDNGVLRLGATAQTSTPYQPLAQLGVPIISAYGADMRTHTTGSVRYKLTGTAPNRVLTVEWFNNQSNFNSGGTADLTFQIRLYETTGVIEFVYGSMTMSTLGAADTNSNDPHIGYSSSNIANTVGSVTAPQAGVPTFNGTSNDPTENLYTAGAITVLTSAVDGSRRTMSFTPPTPVAPAGLNFTAISAISITANWTDSPNEDVYAIYRSTDGTNFSFLATAVENATSYVDNAVLPGTTYFYRVYAVSEGALSTALAGSQATSPAGNDTCNGAGGLWSVPATWTDGSVPTAADNVTIGPACTVTIDTTAAAFGITVNAGGILQFEQTTARTLTVTDDVTIDAGGIFQSNPAGTVTIHQLFVGGDLVNNGTLDLSTNGNTAGAELRFTGTANTTLSGTGATTDLRLLTIQKGAGAINIASPMLEINLSNLSVQGVSSAAPGFLNTATYNGILKISGTNVFDGVVFQTTGYSIPNTAGIWFNNPNFTVNGQNGSPTLLGLLRMTQGTLNIGTATGNSMGFASGSNINIEGGAVNATGRFGVSAAANAITYSQSGGTVTVCTIGNASGTLGSFDLGTSLSSSIAISGGTIVNQLASTGATQIDYRNQAGSGITGVTGGTLQLGNAASGAAKAFVIRGVAPNILLTNTSASHTASYSTTLVNYNNISRNITISTGTTFNSGNVVFLFNGTNITNNGTLTHNGASSNFVIFTTGTTVTYTGTGSVTSPMTNLAVQADGGNFTIDPATSGINVNSVRLFSGNIINANELTIGSGGATTATVQIGNTTTPTNSGTFDSTPTFNPGTGGIVFSYLRSGSTAARNIGPEIPASRSITTFTHDNNFAGHVLTLTGGNLTITGTMTLTNGIVGTSAANTLIHSGATAARTTGYVDGPLRRNFPAIGTYTYFVGQGEYTPVSANVTALGAVGDGLTVSSVNSVMFPLGAALSLSRYWDITENGDVTSDLSFTYGADANDVNGNEADYRVWKKDSTITNMCTGGPCVNTGTNTLGPIVGITSYSQWTGGELLAPSSANASIGGRVVTASGQGIRNAAIVVTGNSLPQPIIAKTGSFGYYTIAGLNVGETYVVTVVSKRFDFSQPSRLISLSDNVTDIDFIAEPIQ
ncbi:MAG: hypothetical protein JNL64_15725 [Blastocatellia bacterium]|nr:hypothetical protein [Blastocatellia bacterium]